MEMLNNFWMAITTPNEFLVSLLNIPLGFIEAYVYMLLFTTILKIPSNRNQKLLYVFSTSFLGIICSFLIPKPYNNLITIIGFPILIKYIFHVKILKAILAELLPIFCVTVLELLVTRLALIIFNCPYELCATIPLLKLICMLLIYLLIYVLYKSAKHFSFNIYIIDTLDRKNKITVLVSLIFAILVIFMQMYLGVYYATRFPLFILLVNILSIIFYFALNVYSMIKTMKLQKTNEDLEQEKLYNKTLQILHDNMRAFKHDFSNIIAGLGGYISTEDIEGLKKYYNELLSDCNQVNNLSCLNPASINNPAVYTVLANKYYKADQLGIKIKLESFIDFTKLNLDIYEFTRILGILMDNAIEATFECDEKLINVTIRDDQRNQIQILKIENTYNDKNINLDQIYKKGFSTKPNNTGLGLWEVNKIISKHKNILIETNKTDKFFIQKIEIYK